MRLGARGFIRGHAVRFDEDTESWVYADTLGPADDKRPCPRCGRMPTKEGYDACLGHIPRVVSACCGHGMEEGYVLRGC